MPETSPDPNFAVSVSALFDAGDAARPAGPLRQRASADDLQLIRDDTGPGLPVCITMQAKGAMLWSSPQDHAVSLAPGGGFLLRCADPRAPLYWLPLMPRQVRLDAQGRLLRTEPAQLSTLGNQNAALQLGFAADEVADGSMVEALIWRLPAALSPRPPGSLERAAWITLGSHTVIQGRGDVYRHLVAGTVFENRLAWPNAWRVFSENDAHSLHLILGGLARAGVDPVLPAMSCQLLLAVLDRQSPDGGFRHGEWTQTMESHYRLHCSAMHLMMDALAAQPDAAVEQALRAAAAFIARQAVPLSFGQWLLHDELEHSVEQMQLGPFKWVPSTVFGKAESNMLVLNSHLDAIIALDRYAEITGDRQHDALVRSARETATAVLSLRPAETLYRFLFWLIEPTFLPAAQAAALPLWKRALKRLTWKYLIPRLPDIKARWPRLVMPGGYIDRELTLRTWAHDYHAINLMDLVRYLRRFDDGVVREVLLQGLAFTRRSGILLRWRELGYQKYALGFWAETLYHVCTLFPDPSYRAWLAEAMLVLEDLQMGQPPSLLGANAEAVPVADQLPCPSPMDARLRVANLGRRGAPELLVLNPRAEPITLAWESAVPTDLRWQRADGSACDCDGLLAPRSWVWACGAL